MSYGDHTPQTGQMIPCRKTQKHKKPVVAGQPVFERIFTKNKKTFKIPIDIPYKRCYTETVEITNTAKGGDYYDQH